MKGIFITFEGIEASGKSTLSNILYKWLRENQINTVITRDPGGTPTGEMIRKILLHAETSIDVWTEALLYAAARRQLVAEIIKPAIFNGSVVICDRFSDSYFAYQGYARGLDLNVIIELNRIATQGIKPDITFLIDLPVDMALKRLNEKDRLELEDKDFHEKVRQGFLKIAENESQRIVVLDGRKPVDELSQIIRETVMKLLNFPA
ncbi:MAG: dTMP kinase [Actinobacteria bacterium]|nr:dTMP kinase [Actinomycetota bacterium]